MSFVNLIAFQSRGCIKAVEFSRRNIVKVFSSALIKSSSECVTWSIVQPQQGFIRKPLILQKWFYLLAKGIWNQVLRISEVIHAFPLETDSTGRILFLNALGFLAFPITRGRSLWVLPSSFVQVRNVIRCLLDFLPDAVVSLLWTRVSLGNNFEGQVICH